MSTATQCTAISSFLHPERVLAGKTRVLVVGGGMAAYGLCRQWVDLGSGHDIELIVFGDEPRLAYDRVHLSKLFDGSDADELLLADASWYQEHAIEFKTNCRVRRIDRESKEIIDQFDVRHAYDSLVIATGSSPFVPPIAGRDCEAVFVYRTVKDLQRIRSHVLDRGAKVGAVIGGGLLGLEAAKILHDLGLRTSVIEMAPGLMPRQLDREGAARLKEHVESIGVEVHLVRRTQSIEVSPSGGLTIHFGNAEPMDTDILIIAAGVRPNDSLAREADLNVGPRGGIVVNSQLQTSDPNIFAIGECCCFNDHVFGLVAPCYRMADVLAQRLAGIDTTFQGADESAELKLLGVQVVTLGRLLGESAVGVVLAFEADSTYRKLILEQGKLVGATCVGPWDEIPQLRHAIAKQKLMWPLQRTRFRRTGSPWPLGEAIPISQWPVDAIVCSCLSVTRGQISDAIAGGARDVEQISSLTRATTGCGSCRSLVCELAGASPFAAATRSGLVMLMTSLLSATIVCIFAFVPALEYATSVQDAWRKVDVLWRSDFARQLTGFSSLGLILLGLVFSLRKRLSWFRVGSYAFWRGLHGVLGTALLLCVAIHTGLRMGQNLNFVLATVLLCVIVVGSVAGIASGLESRTTGTTAMFVRRWRPRLTTLHSWFFWPLPALIALHVISFYWFSD